MGSKKTTQTQTNQYEYKPPPPNPYYENFAKLNEARDYTTPIKQAYGRLRNQIQESGNEIFGANTSAEMRDRVRQSRLFSAMTDEGRELSSGVQNEINDRALGYMSLGDATKAPLVQVGATSVTRQPFDWAGAATGGALGAGSLMTGLKNPVTGMF